MLYKFFITIFISSIALSSSLGFWGKFDKEDQELIVNTYKKCRSGDHILCRGIFGRDCIKGGNCDYIGMITETNDSFAYHHLNLEDFTRSSENPNKNMVYMVGVSPFEKNGDNFTAKCKPKITLNDFKFFIFKANGGVRSSGFSGTQGVSWNVDESGLTNTYTVNKKSWEESCRENLKDINRVINQYSDGRPMIMYENAVTVVNNEYVFILEAGYKDMFTDKEKFTFRDGANYKYTDGVLFTNFENKELPENEKKYKVPPSVFEPPRQTKMQKAKEIGNKILHFFTG